MNGDLPPYLEPLWAELFALRLPMWLVSLGVITSLVLNVVGIMSLEFAAIYVLATGLPTLLLLAATTILFLARDAPGRLVIATNLQTGMWWLLALTGGALSIAVCGVTATSMIFLLGM